MIKASLQATAMYQVTFAERLDASARAQLTRDVAGSLGLSQGVNSDESIKGAGLIWGVRDDYGLLSIRPDVPPVTGGGPTVARRLLPVGALAKVVSSAR